MSGITFDAGGLIALDRNDRRARTGCARGRAWHALYGSGNRSRARHSQPLSRPVCRGSFEQAGTDLIALDRPDATAVGLLLARSATADIVDAHVVNCAQRAGQPVVTSDAGDLRRIAPGLRLLAV